MILRGSLHAWVRNAVLLGLDALGRSGVTPTNQGRRGVFHIQASIVYQFHSICDIVRVMLLAIGCAFPSRELVQGVLTETLQSPPMSIEESIDDISIVLVDVAAAAVPVDDMAMVIDEAIVDMAIPDMELISILSDRRCGIRVSMGGAAGGRDGEEWEKDEE